MKSLFVSNLRDEMAIVEESDWKPVIGGHFEICMRDGSSKRLNEDFVRRSERILGEASDGFKSSCKKI